MPSPFGREVGDGTRLHLAAKRRFVHRASGDDTILKTHEVLPAGSESITVMGDVTRILTDIERGDPRAAELLLPLVYDELRKLAAQKMAQENPGQTLQPTALVHEAYLRLVNVYALQTSHRRAHFFCAAAP